MRSTAPNLKIIFQSVEPSSPPQTPTAASPVSSTDKSSGPGISVSHTRANMRPMSQPPNLRPLGNGPNFSFSRPTHPDQLSPQSSGLSSTLSDSYLSESESLSSEDLGPVPVHAHTHVHAHAHAHAHTHTHTHSHISAHAHAHAPAAPTPVPNGRVVTHASFTVEELSDFGESDEDRHLAILPHAIEDAESDRSQSQSPTPPGIDKSVLNKFQDLSYGPDDDDDDDEVDLSDEVKAFIEWERAERKKKRMTSGSITKRTISESIGSDTDLEDVKIDTAANLTPSNARRLRRKVDRSSLSPINEPSAGDDEFIDGGPLSELPYYRLDYISMEIDSP